MVKVKKFFWFLCFVVFLILIWFIVRHSKISLIAPIPQITLIPSPTPSGEVTFAKVTRIIDGDTIVIDTGQHVRYIGMNTPEIETSECYATEASEINKNLVFGKEVKLLKDVSETDKYGRLLRFVYVGDVFVDDYLAKDGAAKIITIPPDVEDKDLFLQSQEYAKENNLGLWGKCQ